MSSSGIPVIGGAFGVPIVGNVNGVVVSGTPSSGQVLTATSSTAADWQSPSAGTPAFSAITSGTNTGMAGVIGTGASLTVSGSGTNNATAIDGVTVTGTPTAGQVPTATSGSAASWQTPTASAVNAIPLPNILRSWYWNYGVAQAASSATTTFTCGGLEIACPECISASTTTTFGYAGVSTNGATASLIPSYLSQAQFYVGKSLQMTTFMGWTNSSTSTAALNWLGFSDRTTAVMVASGNPAGNYACFRFQNGTDTNFQCITKDGTTQTVIDSGVAPSAAFWGGTAGHLWQIISNDAVPNVQFFIDGALVATSTSHLPTAGTAMQWMNANKSSTSQLLGIIIPYVYITATI